jgi:regulator of sigma E protease
MNFIWGAYQCYGGLPFLFELSVVVFFHELGHFLIARWRGVRVLTFSLGFGPELFGFTDRSGTRWKVSAIPLGGYVKFFGDENAASVPDSTTLAAMSADERQHSFFHKPLGSRAAVVAAGPFANFILSIIILSGVALFYGERIVTLMPRVDELTTDGAAKAAGFEAGDVIRSIDGQAIKTFLDMQQIVSESPGRSLTVVVDRQGTPVTLKVAPAEIKGLSIFGYQLSKSKGVLGIRHASKPRPEEERIDRVGPVRAVQYGVEQTWAIISGTLSGIGGIITARESASQIGGPITIAVISCQVAAEGFVELLKLAAFLSVSIGLLNLFPIPLLDGGHLLYYGIEAVRGRPLSERAQELGFRIGLAIIVMLMAFALFNDFTRSS